MRYTVNISTVSQDEYLALKNAHTKPLSDTQPRQPEPSTLDRIETLLADMNARMERMEDWIMSMKGEAK